MIDRRETICIINTTKYRGSILLDSSTQSGHQQRRFMNHLGPSGSPLFVSACYRFFFCLLLNHSLARGRISPSPAHSEIWNSFIAWSLFLSYCCCPAISCLRAYCFLMVEIYDLDLQCCFTKQEPS